MEKFIEYSGEKFKVKYYFDPDVKETVTDSKTGEIYKNRLGNIEGILIYSSDGELLGSFDHIDFDDNKIIKKIIQQIY